ncbi:MAG: hypothetical protein NT077_04530 [Candidatus Taylorbacteria bacterium]|nr:hypothetical protein [Candidatus Taylorbacteria bacterium]
MSDENNRIEDLKQSLYSRNAPDVRSRRRQHISNETSDVPSDWGNTGEQNGTGVSGGASNESHHSMSFFTKLLIFSAIFCVIAVGVGAYVFWNGANFISGNNIEINISGPISVPGGTPVSFTITVKNKNTVALKTADLSVHFPAGTTDPADTTQSLEVYREALGDLPSGGSVTKNVDAVIFGEQNLQKKITAAVTYGIAGSNSVFTKESSYDVIVNASPVSLTTSAPEEAISGQPFDLNIDIKSNSTNTIKNVIMRAAYPFGYTFKSSTVRPVNGDNVWSIGDIPPGGERKISIKGALTGEDSDFKVFHFTVGAKSPSNPTIIGTTFMETEQVLNIKKPFVTITIAVDGDASRDDHVGFIGRPLQMNLRWENNLPETLSNVVITAHLAGSAYDKNNVSTWNGYFRSLSDDVIWDQKTNPELASIASGANGSLSFSVTPSESQGSYTHILNPEITISSTASGDRTSSNNVPLNTGTVIRKIRIATTASLSSRLVRNGGAFVNYGPIPPVAEKKTTYTVIWSVENTSNMISNGVVSATLPPGVSWAGEVSPKGEDITYDKNSGKVTWNVGNIEAFTSANNIRKEAQFQIIVEPSVDQIGSAPIVVNPASFTGTDSWTGSKVESSQGYLTTSFNTDPTFKPGDAAVVR